MIGQRVGSYEITAKLGEGGMGEVYRAHDTKLKREVAIKVLPAAFTEDRERLARFEREAQLLAQLQHTNIASIYGLEESGGTRALVMELVEGPTLAERLEHGPLPFIESLSVAVQIAQALEEAHEKGIVHRDLKPQNVKASIAGKVKVLDFGLAKAMDPVGTASGAGASASQLAKSPTLTMGATQMGVILGTAAYMSPEQAKGMPVDKRADIWAFGVVLYEMLVGGTLFAGESVGDTLAAVIRAEIDLGKLPAETPVAIRQLLRRCLERNPRNRLHDIADARIVLEEVQSGRAERETSGVAAAAVVVAPAPRWPYLLAALGLVVGLVALWRPWAEPVAPVPAAPAFRLEIAPLETAQSLPGLAISPDGTQLVFVARGEDSRLGLWLRPLASYEARLLPGTAGARYPFWSPDGKRIGFFADAQLKVTDLVGVPRVIAGTATTADTRGGSWGADDTIVFAPTFHGGLLRVSARGGEATPLTAPPPGSELGTYRLPQFLPDGRRFLFYASAAAGLEPGQILLGRIDSDKVKALGESHSMAVLAPPDRVLYARGDQLVAQRLDLEREELVGDPEPLGVTLTGGIAVSGHRSLSVSRTGLIAVRQDTRNVTRPVWVDRAGREIEALRESAKVWWYGPRLAPGGRRVAIARYEVGGSDGDIWVHDFERNLGTRLTFEGGEEQLAAWTPDGRRLAYVSTRPGRPFAMYVASADRPGDQRLLFERDEYILASFVTPDGKELVFDVLDTRRAYAIWSAPLDGSGPPRQLFTDPGGQFGSAVSADGRWVAYCSDATRRLEVYARRLDGSDEAIQVSVRGGCQPVWRADGRELFYVADDGKLMAVGIEPGDTLRVAPPQALFDARLEDSTDRQYDVAADGQRFFLNQRTGEDVQPILILSGWDRGLAEQR